jgi:drug/metabolite transporter (DMT)-like permease
MKEEAYDMQKNILQRSFNQPLILLFILGFAWGSAFSLARYVMSHQVSPITYSFFTIFSPSVVLLIYCYRHGYLQDLIKGDVLCYFVTGMFGIVLPNTNKYWLATHLPSGVLALVMSVTPFFIYPLALLCREEKFHFSRITAVLIGGAGMIIMAAQHGILGLTLNHWLFLSLLTPFSYAVCAVYVAKFAIKKNNIVVLTTGMLICATLLLTPFLFTSEFVMPHLALNGVWLTITTEIILETIGYLLLFKVLQLSGAVNYSMVNGIAAIVGLFWGYCFFHECISLRILLAMLCILLGVLLLNRFKVQTL